MNTFELLNAEAIRRALTPAAASHLAKLDILNAIDSTNAYLLNKKDLPCGYVCLAEQQTAGRGRLNKVWHSPASENIYLSLNWRFLHTEQLAGLSLVIGIAAANALRNYGLVHLALKWPNDILYQNKKLSGILVETLRENSGGYRAIIGIGVNVNMPKENNHIDQPWTDVAAILNAKPQRNLIISYLLNELFAALPAFQAQGLSAFLKEWRQYDVIFNKPVTVIQAEQRLKGIATGIDAQGNLLVEIDGVIKPFCSGEISIRLGEK